MSCMACENSHWEEQAFEVSSCCRWNDLFFRKVASVGCQQVCERWGHNLISSIKSKMVIMIRLVSILIRKKRHR